MKRVLAWLRRSAKHSPSRAEAVPVPAQELGSLRREVERLERRVEELVHELGPERQRNAVLNFKLHELSERNKILEIREPALRASLAQARETIQRLRRELEAARKPGAGKDSR